MRVAIVSVIYQEPYWIDTKKCIQALNLPTVFVDRKGVGSLAEAYNRGFQEAQIHNPDLVWFVSNVTFKPDTLQKLVDSLGDYCAIHARFDSDHRHMKSGFGVIEVPFLEFTAPLVRNEVYKNLPLDENLPYWGHDLVWGYEAQKLGYKMAVNYDIELGHTYIRNSKPHPITRERQRLRRLSDKATSEYLRNKYGNEWRVKLFPKNEKEISNLYDQVSNQIQPQPEKLALIDFDGVLTDGKYYLNHKGEKRFYSLHARDNAAIAELISKGYAVTIITANNSPIIEEYAKQRKCEYLYSRDKAMYSDIAVGDSVFDIPMLKMSKQAFCPANADSEVLKIKGIKVLPVKGGEGVISELIKQL